MASRIISVLFKSNALTEAGKVTTYGKALSGVGPSATKMGTDVKRSGGMVSSALGSMGVDAGKFGGVMKAGMVGGAVAGGAALLSFAKKGVDAFVGLAGEVRGFQRATGASAEDSSRWVAVLDDMEIASDKGEKAAFKLLRTIGDGGEKLREHGVQVKTNNDGTVNLSETLLSVADAYTSTEDPAKRAAMVQEAFGRAGKDLIPVLEQGRDGIKRFFEGAEEGHQILSQDEIDKAREYELAMDQLGDVMRGFSIDIGSAVTPSVTSATNALSTGIAVADKVTVPFGGIGKAFSFMLDHSPLGLFNDLESTFGSGNSVWERGAGIFDTMSANLFNVTGLFSDGGDAAATYSDEQGRVGEATKRVADLEADGKRGTKEYRDARNELQSASAEFADVQGRVSEATKDVTTSLAFEQFAVDPLAAQLKDVVAASDDLVRSQFLAGDALATGTDAKIKARDAERELLVAVGEGDTLRAEAAVLAAANARSQEVYSDALLRGVHPATAAKDAAAAYRLELGMLGDTIPADSPLRASLERDLGLMEAHKEGMKGKNATLWADMFAIASTGGMNQVAVEQLWRDFGAVANTIKDDNERGAKLKLTGDLTNIIATGGQDQAAVWQLLFDVQALKNDEGGKKISGALNKALGDGTLTTEEIMGLYQLILTSHVNTVLTGVGASPIQPIKAAGLPFAQGGVMEADNSRAAIYPGGPVRYFAEKVTRNEAFIPERGANDPFGVLSTAAGWHGYEVVPKSRGAARRFAEGGLTLEELFYDPRGGWDNGVSVGAIGGHGSHVHAGAASGHTWPELDAYLVSQGIMPGPGSTTGGRHAVGSLHYQGRAKDYGSAANPNLNAIWDAFLPLARGIAAALGIKLPEVPPVPDFGPGWASPVGGTGAATHARNVVLLWQANVQAMLDAQMRAAAGGGGVGGGVHAGPFKEYAASRLAAFGWGPEQFGPLDMLWTAESNWDENAQNPTSDAAGIPQDITGNLHGGGYGQIDWGLNYIKQRYGSPAAAWAFHQRNNWYREGGIHGPVTADWGADLVPGLNVLRNNTGAIEKLRPVESGAPRGDTVFDFRGALIYGDRRSFERMVSEVFDGRQEVAAQDARRA